MPILVTGAAGFIGHAVSRRLLERGESVAGIDDFNAYYDPALKRRRAADLARHPRFHMTEADIAEPESLAALARRSNAETIVHLAAQAGVRHSIDNPFAFERANVAGQLSVLEAARRSENFRHLVYASSSSVYGERPLDRPFREEDVAATPASLYAATKRSAELLAANYAHLYRLPLTCLRLFSVYGPWGRPDMAYFSFAEAILAGRPIRVFGEGRMARDFTFIDDVVDAVIGVLDRPAAAGEHRVLNVGGGRPVGLLRMIGLLEAALGRTTERIMLPMQPGDVTATSADIARLKALIGYAPKVSLEEGLRRFAAWYLAYRDEPGGGSRDRPIAD
jgi:UDP-glucuronate 4-epimerase